LVNKKISELALGFLAEILGIVQPVLFWSSGFLE